MQSTFFHKMNKMCACFKRTHHFCRCLAEHAVGQMIEEVALELEVYDEVHVSPGPRWCERPRVCQVLQRPSFSSSHQHLPRSVQRDLAREAFPKWTKPDFKVGDDFLRILAVDSCAAAPGYK